MAFWSLWWDAASWRVKLLSYITFFHFYFVPFLTLTNVFLELFSSSLSVIFCVLPFIDSLLFGSLAS